MRSKLASWCDGFIEAGILVAIIGAPLFFNIHSDRVFEPDKLTLVRSLALLMAGMWLVGFIERMGWKELDWLRWRSDTSIWRMPFVLAVFLLVVIYLVSTAFSVVPRTSWAGSYQRLQGTYTTLSYIVIFALAVYTLRRRDQINRLVTTVIITSIPVSLYALLQHYGLDPLPWGGNVQVRVAGHMGNAIFIAAYLIMAVPLTVVRIIDAFTNILSDEELSYADVVRSSVYIFTVAIQLVAIYWSGSRGPMLGLMIGMFALVLILLVSLRNAVTEQGRFRLNDLGRALLLVLVGTFVAGGFIYLLVRLITSTGRLASLSGAAASLAAFAGALGVVAVAIFVLVAMRRGWRWLWLSWLMLTAVGIVWLGLFNLAPEIDETQAPAQTLSGRVIETVDAWRQLPTVGRFGRLLEAERGTGRVRVLIWQGALELLRPHEPLVFPDGETDTFNFLRPLIGYGPESMYVAYNPFYVPELATIEARNASPDRSHNETFDALIITGLLGFLIWQALYLSVFYYGFRWLGVVRSNRDRNVLIALWIAGAILGALIITELLGLVYIGVAIPFGSIAGLALYLVYYALFASTGLSIDAEVSTVAKVSATAEANDPFQVDRLLLMGLLAAVVAHYVEIHFGIAIASTRVHFFIYVALMLLVGYVLPRYREQQVAVAEAPGRSRRRWRQRPGRSGPAWLGPVLAATFVQTVIIGILGYEFMNYSQPPGVTVQTLADVPSAGDILHQAFFVHPGQGFIDSPFIFLLIILSWILGTLASLSEMVRQGILSTSTATTSRTPQNYQTAGVVFIILVLVGFATRFLQSEAGATGTSQLLGQGLIFMWSALCLFAALWLFRRHRQAGEVAGFTAATGLALAIPVLIAGSGVYGTAMLLACASILYLLWGGRWTAYAGPGLIIAIPSIVTGFIYVYLHAYQIRNAIYLGPPQSMPDLQRLIFSADRFAGFLTLFYAFIIALLLIVPFGIARSRMAQARQSGSILGYVTLVLVIVAGLFLVTTTNLRIIQADIVYKQARPLDSQASRASNAQAWEAPIAIYEHAIELAPVEDFYYLFLGRAYLEQSAVTTDEQRQSQLLETARERLLEAQRINPLNTDHTANLARLNTRWSNLSSLDEQRRDELLQQAKAYYQDALALSPQNSVIRNEYGNLLATLDNDCPSAIDTFERSLAIDPFFVQTYYGLAGVYEICAGQQAPEEQETYYRRAAQLLEEGLERSQDNASSVLLQAARLYQQAGEIDMARTLANQALTDAPPEAQEQIQAFLDQLAEQ